MRKTDPGSHFLPDATSESTSGLLRVGYRLATLSALPPTVPVSRVKLADAGFYFRGDGDEVTCFSCHLRHSGWTKDDKPIEVHRRLSPQCEIVLQHEGRVQPLAYSAIFGSHRVSDRVSDPVSGVSHPSQLNRSASQGTCYPQHRVGFNQSRQHSELETTATNASSLDQLVPTPAAEHLSENSSHTPAVTQENVSHAFGASRHSTSPEPSYRFQGALSGSVESVATNSTGTFLHETEGSSAFTVSTSSSAAELCFTSAVSARGLRAATDSEERNSSLRPLLVLSIAASGISPSSVDTGPLFPTAGLDLGGAVYPMYHDMASWNHSQAPPLDDVILCGMFYAGYADCIRCFYCGVGLKHWAPTDDVWTEHVRWRPGCQYLRAVKGEQFIRDTQRRLGMESAENEGLQRNSTAHNQQPPATAIINTSQQYPQPALPVSLPLTTSDNCLLLPVSPGIGITFIAGAPENVQSLPTLQTENRELTRRFQCQACRQANIDTILLPCGHLVLCETCARSAASCPLCQDVIRGTSKVYME